MAMLSSVVNQGEKVKNKASWREVDYHAWVRENSRGRRTSSGGGRCSGSEGMTVMEEERSTMESDEAVTIVTSRSKGSSSIAEAKNVGTKETKTHFTFWGSPRNRRHQAESRDWGSTREFARTGRCGVFDW